MFKTILLLNRISKAKHIRCYECVLDFLVSINVFEHVRLGQKMYINVTMLKIIIILVITANFLSEIRNSYLTAGTKGLLHEE